MLKAYFAGTTIVASPLYCIREQAAAKHFPAGKFPMHYRFSKSGVHRVPSKIVARSVPRSPVNPYFGPAVHRVF
jgi:hypothetical protein